LIRDAEKALKQLRADIRKRAQAAPKNLEAAAARLRKGAADIAGQVKKYVHDLRVNLEGKKPAAAKRRPARRKAARKGTARKRTARARA
jgi:hypothetical protein